METTERPKKILLVDDSRSFITYLTQALRKMGFSKIVIAENGVEALKILKLWIPNVVILDINMPELDGISTLRKIREDREFSALPVIMVTSRRDRKSFSECLSLGCSGYLTKPVAIPALHDLLQECIAFTASNKRFHLRTPFHRPVTVDFKGTSSEYEAVTLSEGGVYLRAGRPLPTGSELSLTIPLKGRKPLRVKGSVIYHFTPGEEAGEAAPGMAVLFTDLDEKEEAFLNTHLTRLITGSSE